MSSTFSTTCRLSGNFSYLSEFGQRLKEAFETTEIAELSRKLGVTYQAAKNYVDGRLPAPEKLIEISRSTGCSIDWLLTGVGEKYRTTVVRTFDVERSVELHDDWRQVMEDWYKFEGSEMPDTFGASFMGGWPSFGREEKIAALRDFKKLLDLAIQED